jgi:hypothetical protein
MRHNESGACAGSQEVRSMVATTAVRNDDRVMGLLAAGVPLTLLIDLVDPLGPPSREILLHESGDAPNPPLRARATA